MPADTRSTHRARTIPMTACPRCKAPLEAPLACSACGTLLAAPDDASPFAIFGLPVAYALDHADLRRRLLRFSRLTHPDFFATQDAASRALAERNTALLNRAHAVLSDDVERAEWIVDAAAGLAIEKERAMPPEFLLEVLEWNEALEEFRAQSGESDRGRIDELKRALTARRAESLERIARGLSG